MDAAPDATDTASLDDDRLDAMIDRWRGALIGLVRAWGSTDPIDLAQEVFAEAWLSRGNFRGDWDDPNAVAPWLRGIAWNLVAARRRARARGPRPLESAPEPSAPITAEDESGDAIRRAVDRLPQDQRIAILVHYIERTPVRETAALLGTTEKSIEGRLYRGRRNLAQLLEAGAPKTTELRSSNG